MAPKLINKNANTRECLKSIVLNSPILTGSTVKVARYDVTIFDLIEANELLAGGILVMGYNQGMVIKENTKL